MTLKERIDAFWTWFQKRSEDYFYLEKDGMMLFGGLEEALGRVEEDLAFEFKHDLIDGKRVFVISANGLRELLLCVLAMVERAPVLEKFHIVAFRQPSLAVQEDMELVYRGVSLKCSDVFFSYKRGRSDVIDVNLYIRGYKDSAAWIEAAFLFLDKIVGEFEVMTKIGEVEMARLIPKKGQHLHGCLTLSSIVAQVNGLTMDEILGVSGV